MKLVIGGAYQGKLAYAKETYHIEEDGWADGRTCGREALLACRGVYQFHEYVRRMLSEEGGQLRGKDLLETERRAEQFAQELARANPGIVIVTNELGYGIVPLEKEDRLWREITGRVCTCLAAQADEVVRVVCGIGVRLKAADAV